jgi:uncharacterized protein (TIGR02118 family)
MVRFLVLYPQPQDVAAFESHYRDVHIPLARKLIGLRRYTISRNAAPIRGGEPYYLVAELDWDDEVAVKGTFTDTLTSRQETCDQYVHGQAQATTLWVVPLPGRGGTPDGGHAVSFTAGVPSKQAVQRLSRAWDVFVAVGDRRCPPYRQRLVPSGKRGDRQHHRGERRLWFSNLLGHDRHVDERGRVRCGAVEMRGLKRAKRWICVTCGLIAVACSGQPSASSTHSPQPSTAGQGPTLIGWISVAGDFSISSRFATSAEKVVGGFPTPASPTGTCAGYANGLGNPQAFAAPELTTKGDTSLYFRAFITFGYAGPGTYQSRSTPGLAGNAAVTVGTGGPVTVYNPKRGGTTTLTVAPDGSGTLTFSRWPSDETRGTNIAGYLDGTLRWSCQ